METQLLNSLPFNNNLLNSIPNNYLWAGDTLGGKISSLKYTLQEKIKKSINNDKEQDLEKLKNLVAVLRFSLTKEGMGQVYDKMKDNHPSIPERNARFINESLEAITELNSKYNSSAEQPYQQQNHTERYTCDGDCCFYSSPHGSSNSYCCIYYSPSSQGSYNCFSSADCCTAYFQCQQAICSNALDCTNSCFNTWLQCQGEIFSTAGNFCSTITEPLINCSGELLSLPCQAAEIIGNILQCLCECPSLLCACGDGDCDPDACMGTLAICGGGGAVAVGVFVETPEASEETPDSTEPEINTENIEKIKAIANQPIISKMQTGALAVVLTAAAYKITMDISEFMMIYQAVSKYRKDEQGEALNASDIQEVISKPQFKNIITKLGIKTVSLVVGYLLAHPITAISTGLVLNQIINQRERYMYGSVIGAKIPETFKEAEALLGAFPVNQKEIDNAIQLGAAIRSQREEMTRFKQCCTYTLTPCIAEGLTINKDSKSTQPNSMTMAR